ncbi:DUF1045 domain-containing protein [Paraburkholderia sp. BCC1886]|uniref:DUF1045 domain-containing protein n=1 Tax=Paraburkholderia sp. BCC1886 TaxID=2562670 RepID=UPI001183208B|nr:DUF1045 domain-containing protein [Paraburkholderia sp. BCC1886]
MSGTVWSDAARFALYYAPARESAWWQVGSAWLGRDAQSGEPCVPPQPADLARPLTELTGAPRRYGWHGTLVAPFRLAAGVTQQQLLQTARDWARTRAAFALPVTAASLGDFVALRPAHPQGDADMRELAGNALQTLDALRAQPSSADLARRLAAPLSERQRELLLAWGYPYVFEEFRFHMTLSSSLADADTRAVLLAWWEARLPDLGPLVVDQVALFVEPEPGAPFLLWERLPLQGREASEA